MKVIFEAVLRVQTGEQKKERKYKKILRTREASEGPRRPFPESIQFFYFYAAWQFQSFINYTPLPLPQHVYFVLPILLDDFVTPVSGHFIPNPTISAA